MPEIPWPKVPELAEALAGAMPSLRASDRALALAVYRQLAGGEPVLLGALAMELGRGEAEIAESLERWPGVFRDDDGRIIGFWGLAIREMRHRFRVGGRQLYTWCAWDALFIPELIGQPAEVESRPPGSGEAVRLVVDPGGVRQVAPETAVVSMLSPTEAFDHRVITGFCHFVHFFPSEAAGTEWTSRHAGTFLLSVGDAHELGRIVNRLRFGGPREGRAAVRLAKARPAS